MNMVEDVHHISALPCGYIYLCLLCSVTPAFYVYSYVDYITGNMYSDYVFEVVCFLFLIAKWKLFFCFRHKRPDKDPKQRQDLPNL